MKKVKKMGTGGLPAGSPERTVPRGATGPTPSIGPQRMDRPDLVTQMQRDRRDQRQTGGEMRPQRGDGVMPAPRPTPMSAPMLASTPRKGFGMPREMPGKMADRIRLPAPMKKGGSVSSASKRADGIAAKGKTKGRMI